MSSEKIIELLTEIKGQLKNNGDKLDQILGTLREDRVWMWRILALVIMGAFALIGVKLVIPD